MNPEQPEERNEFIESQADEAAKILESKGYVIGTLMGQSGRSETEMQALIFEYPKRKLPEGLNFFDEGTMAKLRKLGVKNYSGAIHADQIAFEFSDHGLTEEQLREKWIELANILPPVKRK